MYFIILQIVSPGTFLSTILGFSSVWFWLAVFFVVLFCFRKKKLFSKAKKSIKILVISILSVGVIVSIVCLCFITHPRLANGNENPKYVILLGGGITKDAELTDSMWKRVRHAAEYLKKNPNAIVVVTGGQGNFSPCPESDVLKPALASCGINESRILAEDKAKDTIQNFKYSARLLAKNQNVPVQEILNSSITIVTSDFHLARAERLAKYLGFTNIYGTAAKTPILFMPTSYAREICCYIKLTLRQTFFANSLKPIE